MLTHHTRNHPALLLALCLGFTAGLTSCATEPSVVSQTVLISYWNHTPADPSGRVPGIDLDRRTSTAVTARCDDARDGERLSDGGAGIDNQYGFNLVAALNAALPEPLSPAISEQLVRGEYLYGFEIAADPADPNAPVVVTLLRFEALAPLTATPDGRLDGTGLGASTPLTEVTATREHGALFADFGDLDIPMGDVLGASPIEGVSIRFEVNADGSVTGGDLGGAVSLETVLNVTGALNGGTIPFDLEGARSFAQPDLQPSADGSRCNRVSFGVGLEFVSVAP